MDIRDLQVWIEEAKIARLIRQSEAYNASLLPHRKQADVNAEIERLKWKIYETEHGDKIDELDRKADEKRKRDALKRRRKRKKS